MPLPHAFKGKILYFSYCIHCGLILFRNRATEKAARKPCPDREQE